MDNVVSVCREHRKQKIEVSGLIDFRMGFLSRAASPYSQLCGSNSLVLISR